MSVSFVFFLIPIPIPAIYSSLLLIYILYLWFQFRFPLTQSTRTQNQTKLSIKRTNNIPFSVSEITLANINWMNLSYSAFLSFPKNLNMYNVYLGFLCGMTTILMQKWLDSYKDTQFESLFETGEIKERKNGRGRKRKILIMSNKPSGCVCVDLFVCVCVSNQFYV